MAKGSTLKYDGDGQLVIPQDVRSEVLRREFHGVYARSDCGRLRRGLVASHTSWDEFLSPAVQTLDAVHVNKPYDAEDDHPFSEEIAAFRRLMPAARKYNAFAGADEDTTKEQNGSVGNAASHTESRRVKGKTVADIDVSKIPEDVVESTFLDTVFPHFPSFHARKRKRTRRGTLSKASQSLNNSIEVMTTLAKLHPAETIFDNYSNAFLGRKDAATHTPLREIGIQDREILAKTVPSSVYTTNGNGKQQEENSPITPSKVLLGEGKSYTEPREDKEDVVASSRRLFQQLKRDDPSAEEKLGSNETDLAKSFGSVPLTRKNKDEDTYIKTKRGTRVNRSVILSRFSHDNKLKVVSEPETSHKTDLADTRSKGAVHKCVSLALGSRGKDPYALICPPEEAAVDAINGFYGFHSLGITPYMGPPPAESNDYGDKNSKVSSGPSQSHQSQQEVSDGLKIHADGTVDGLRAVDTISGHNMQSQLSLLSEASSANGNSNGNSNGAGSGPIAMASTGTGKSLNWRDQQKYGKHGALAPLAEELFRRLVKYPRDYKLKLRRNRRIEVPVEMQEKPASKSWRNAHETDATRNSHKAMLVVDKHARSRVWAHRPLPVGPFGYKAEVAAFRPAMFLDEEGARTKGKRNQEEIEDDDQDMDDAGDADADSEADDDDDDEDDE